MQIRPQLIHHWLLILLLAVLFVLGQSFGVWAASNSVAVQVTPTPAAPDGAGKGADAQGSRGNHPRDPLHGEGTCGN